MVAGTAILCCPTARRLLGFVVLIAIVAFMYSGMREHATNAAERPECRSALIREVV
jgi:hypothetical protein